jgi:uncharacterized protein
MLRWLALLWLALLAPTGWAADDLVALPPLTARVTDLTGTLAQEQRTQLEDRLAALEREKGAQVAVLLLPTVRPESIEQFGIRLAESWKIGRKGVDDGVIFIVAKNDRELRIEVGYGLEGAIPDATAKRVIDEIVVPRFKQGDFFGGIEAGVERLAGLIAGEPLPEPETTAGSSEAEDSYFALMVFAMMAAPFARALLGVAGALIAAGVAGYFAYALFASWIAVLIAGAIVFVFSLARASGGGGGGSWSSGGGGFSSGSGGFSGGGGSFGGGGSSGSW